MRHQSTNISKIAKGLGANSLKKQLSKVKFFSLRQFYFFQFSDYPFHQISRFIAIRINLNVVEHELSLDRVWCSL